MQRKPHGIQRQNLLQGCNLLIDCTDNYAARYLIDDICAEFSIPWIYGSIGEFHGQLTLFGGATRRRYAELYPDRDTLAPCLTEPKASSEQYQVS